MLNWRVLESQGPLLRKQLPGLSSVVMSQEAESRTQPLQFKQDSYVSVILQGAVYR